MWNTLKLDIRERHIHFMANCASFEFKNEKRQMLGPKLLQSKTQPEKTTHLRCFMQHRMEREITL